MTIHVYVTRLGFAEMLMRIAFVISPKVLKCVKSISNSCKDVQYFKEEKLARHINISRSIRIS